MHPDLRESAKTYRYHWIAVLTLALLAALLGAVVLLGWYTRNEALIQINPAFVPMQYNTALGFLLSGLGLLYSFDHNARYQLRLIFSADSDILSYVPADTSFFSGGTQAKPFKHLLDLYAPEYAWIKHFDWQQLKQK